MPVLRSLSEIGTTKFAGAASYEVLRAIVLFGGRTAALHKRSSSSGLSVASANPKVP